MVLRKPNLLDAFQASAPEGKKAPPGKPPAHSAGPFAHERAASAPAPRPASTTRSLWSQMASDRLVQFAVVVCIAGVGIAYYLGRTGTQPVNAQAAGEAAPGGGTLVQQEPAPKNAAPTPDPAEANRKVAALSESEHDRNFFDPKYKFTVRAAQYPNDDAGKKAAFADRDYLRAEGLPVVKPLQNGRILVLCVGYAATIAELKSTLDYVSKLRGPSSGRKNPYHDAWVDNINHVAAR